MTPAPLTDATRISARMRLGKCPGIRQSNQPARIDDANKSERKRHRPRLVVTFRGLCLFLSLLLASSILAGWLDWRMPGHLPSLMRALILVASVSGAGVIGYLFLLKPLLSPTDDLSLALGIENYYPSLIDSLASTVEFLEIPEESEASGSAGLRRAAIQQTLRQLKEINFNRVVDTRG